MSSRLRFPWSALSQYARYVIAGRRIRWGTCGSLSRAASPPADCCAAVAPVRALAVTPASPVRLPSHLGPLPNNTVESKPMSLVAYPDSASDSGGDSPAPKPGLKRKRGEPDAAASNHLPPLPAAFHDLYSTNARVSTSDDPSLHGGRKRAVPHIKGNWPSHVFLECMYSPGQ